MYFHCIFALLLRNHPLSACYLAQLDQVSKSSCLLQVIGFASRQDAEDYMLANPESTLGAVHFDVDDTTAVPKINYMIQSNSTVRCVCISCFRGCMHDRRDRLYYCEITAVFQ